MLTTYTIEGFENIQYQGFQALSQIEHNLTNLYTGYGYHQVAIPTFETYDSFIGNDAISANELFKFIKAIIFVKSSGKKQITAADEELIKQRAIQEFLASQKQEQTPPPPPAATDETPADETPAEETPKTEEAPEEPASAKETPVEQTAIEETEAEQEASEKDEATDA